MTAKAETQRERLLYLMVLNLASSMGEMQQALLAIADSLPMDDGKKAEVLRHNESMAVQFHELMARLKEYQTL